LQVLIEDSIKNGLEVETVIGDGASSGKDNLVYSKRENIKIVAKLNCTIAQGARKDEDKFDYNKDADRFVCPAGHMAIKKAKGGKKNVGKNQVETYYFDVEK
tara:strand:+ start:17756 stop:18061 length:306 start_codon:yes stop_codon:yes gene_type:complete